LLYNDDRQRLVSFGRFGVREYDSTTWKLSQKTGPYLEASARTTRPGAQDKSHFGDPQEIIGLDASERRVLLRSWGDPRLELLDRDPVPRWVSVEIPAEGSGRPDAAAFSADGALLTLAYPVGGTSVGTPAERVAHVWDTATGK